LIVEERHLQFRESIQGAIGVLEGLAGIVRSQSNSRQQEQGYNRFAGQI